MRQSHGASVSAVRHGLCVDTSMGLTPLEGLMMGHRSGSIASGILVYPLRQNGLDAGQLDVPASTGRILVIATREAMIIVRETQRVLSRS